MEVPGSLGFLLWFFPPLIGLASLTDGELIWAFADTVQDIKDPEHPYSLEQIRCVLSQESVSVSQ